MGPSSTFVSVAGGVTGQDHRRACRDGQDGFALVATPSVCAAIVTDGCSSGRMSEVGARLGAAWLKKLVEAEFEGSTDPAEAARSVTAALTARLEVMARSLSPADGLDPDVIGQMLLFGFLAAVVAADSAIVFGVG